MPQPTGPPGQGFQQQFLENKLYILYAFEHFTVSLNACRFKKYFFEVLKLPFVKGLALLPRYIATLPQGPEM